MNDDKRACTRVACSAGQCIELDGAGQVWRLERGLVGLVGAGPDHDIELLVMPGDLLGLDLAQAPGQPLRARALSDVALCSVPADPVRPDTALLQEALAQARRQCREMLRLRSGQVAERLQWLLERLAGLVADGHPGAPLAPLMQRDLAWIIGASAESVCRMLARQRPAGAARLPRAAALAGPAGFEGLRLVS